MISLNQSCFNDVDEKDKDKLIDEVYRTPTQMIAYHLGWMTLILDWEKQQQQGYTIKELCTMFIKKEQDIIELINFYTDTELFEQWEEGGRHQHRLIG